MKFFPHARDFPQNAIIPEQIIRNHCYKCRGGMGGQALSPLSSYPCVCISNHSKRSFTEPENEEFSRAGFSDPGYYEKGVRVFYTRKL